MVEKEIFYKNEIKALENDNILFHQDLTQANEKIMSLNASIASQNQKEVSMQE